MLKQTAIALSAVLALSACTRSGEEKTTTSQDQSQQSSEQSVTRTEPGKMEQAEKEMGSTDVAIQKETTTVERETEKESVPTVEEQQVKADINRMGKDDFKALGLPEQQAEQIIKYRDEHGNFTSVDQLRNVPGINTAWLSQNSQRLGVG